MGKIDPKPGEIWTCRDGGKARIYAVDGGCDSPIHGAISTERGWDPLTWLENGRVFEYGQNGLDLLCKYDWREELKPIWAVLKPKYRWIAVDESESWWAYQDCPNSGATFWETTGELESLEALTLPTSNCPWNETLTERPE